MFHKILDVKLKSLIQVCKETGNNDTLASTIFTLISNRLNEIGINLAVRARDSNSRENLTEYMELLNEIFVKNLDIFIFEEQLIQKMNDCEQIFYRTHGDVPYNSIKTMVKLYYELRRLDVPNLYREFDDHDMITVPQYGLQSFLSSNSKRKYKHKSGLEALKPLLLQKLKERQLTLQKNSKKKFNSKILETAIIFKKQENTLNSRNTGRKVKFEGKLKDNISYQQSIENIVGYLVVSVSILFLALGISMVLKLTTYPIIPTNLSYWSIISTVAGTVLFIIFIKYFIRRRY